MPSIIKLTFKCTILLGKHHYVKLVTAFLFCASKSLITGLSIMPLFTLIIHASPLISFWNLFCYNSSPLLHFVWVCGSQTKNVIGAICYLQICFRCRWQCGFMRFLKKHKTLRMRKILQEREGWKIQPVLGWDNPDFTCSKLWAWASILLCPIACLLV